jgi:hypothetical protein
MAFLLEHYLGSTTHDDDPALRIHGLQPGVQFPNFHGAPSWRLSCGVGFLRYFYIARASRTLQGRNMPPRRRPGTIRESAGVQDVRDHRPCDP